MDTGKKIDTWGFKLPDGKRLDIDIHLHSRSGEMHFTSQTDHPVFRFLKHKNTDLQLLRVDVQRDVRDVIETHYGADWRHGRLVEVEYVDRQTDETSYQEESRQFDLRFKVSPIRYDVTRPPGNHGETEIIARDTPQTIIQRSHSDTFEAGDRQDLTSKNMRMMSERGKTVSRAVLPEGLGIDEQLHAVQDVMKRFSAGLADRMSPMRLANEGVPAPHDLVYLMTAAADPECDITIPECEGIRM